MNPTSRHVRTAVPACREAVEQVIRVRAHFGPGICRKQVQTTGELLFHLGLQSVIVTTAASDCITGTLSKIGERKVIVNTLTCRQSSRQELMNIVRVRKDL